jgi:hypothetical protein
LPTETPSSQTSEADKPHKTPKPRSQTSAAEASHQPQQTIPQTIFFYFFYFFFKTKIPLKKL